MSLSLCPRWRNKMYLFILLIYLLYVILIYRMKPGSVAWVMMKFMSINFVLASSPYHTGNKSMPQIIYFIKRNLRTLLPHAKQLVLRCSRSLRCTATGCSIVKSLWHRKSPCTSRPALQEKNYCEVLSWKTKRQSRLTDVVYDNKLT